VNNAAGKPLNLEAEGGAVPLDSAFYIPRPTDDEFRAAVARGDGIVLVKGPRQVGKTSLLARGLQSARQARARVALLDLQTLSPTELASADALCLAFAGLVAEQLDLDEGPEEDWDPARGANANLTRYLSGPVLRGMEGPLVLGLDEVDRVFTTPFSDEVFAMFRGWHNRRALEPDGPWHRLTLAISFATEAHLFIRDLNQSPFNVGTRVTLRDFTLEDVAELNRRYGEPLRTPEELERFYQLLGGHPFLSRKGLHHLATGTADLRLLERRGSLPDGPFGDHLRRMLVLLARDPEISSDLRAFVRRKSPLPDMSLHRLRGAGVLVGEDPANVRTRCRLYSDYLRAALR
jgi:hypothetical protein